LLDKAVALLAFEYEFEAGTDPLMLEGVKVFGFGLSENFV